MVTDRNSCFLMRDNMVVLLMIITFHSFIACNNSQVKIGSRYENGKVEFAYEFPDKYDTLNYTLKMYYPDGKVRKIANVKNGKYFGVIRTYSTSGKIHQIDSLMEPCSVNPGKCDEILIRYYEDGKVSQRYIEKNGTFNGMTQQYTEQGILAKEYNLIGDSIKNGEYKEFYDNGNVSRKAAYRMDTLVGTDYFFKENGDTAKYYQHYPWGKGFPGKEFHDDGTTVQVHYVGGKSKAVVWQWFDKNGKLVKRKIEYPVNGVYKVYK
jgi:antitoxin component YwqK of YwqJK toxin-antitoxin module